MLKSIFKFSVLVIIFTFCTVDLYSQNYELLIKTRDSSNFEVLKSIPYIKNHNSKEDLFNEIKIYANQLSKKGYLNNKHFVKEQDSTVKCTFIINRKTEFIKIRYSSKTIETSLIKQIDPTATDSFFTIPFESSEKTLNFILEYFEKNGFTFTDVYLSNLNLKNNILTAKLEVQKSKKRTIDKVVIKGYPEFPKKYLKHYLNINIQEKFNLESLDQLYELINTINFVTQIKKPEVLFTKDSTILYLYVKKKSRSNFDGIIGFSNEEESGKLKFNGYLDLKLNNILNKGETFNINWLNSQNKNSTLKLNFNSPYAFNSKINLNGTFSIFRQDSLFLNTKGNLTIGYSLNRNNSLQIIGTTEKSDVSTNSSTSYSFENFQKKLGGISYTYKVTTPLQHTNQYRFYANAGYLIGERKDNITSSQQNYIQFTIAYTAHLNNRNSIFLKTKTEILNSTNTFDNELFRIGGVNSIRGFNENSIPTAKYNVSNIEYHYKLGMDSYIYTITDFALLNNTNTNTTNQLYGIGLGFFLNTKSTILNLSYALGKNQNTSFNINDSKIHIKLSYPF